MANLNVKAGDSRDSLGRGRFFPFGPASHLQPGLPDASYWYWVYIYYPIKPGFDCCSDTAICFHYVSPNEMYLFDYLIYHLRPFGITNRLTGTAPPPPDRPLTATPWPGPGKKEQLDVISAKEHENKKNQRVQWLVQEAARLEQERENSKVAH